MNPLFDNKKRQTNGGAMAYEFDTNSELSFLGLHAKGIMDDGSSDCEYLKF